MNLVERAIELTCFAGGKLPSRDALLVAFFDLEKQLGEQQKSAADLQSALVIQTQLVGKKSEVITSQQARIKILEERLNLAAIERFGASSEQNPLQIDCFNEAEVVTGDVTDDDAESTDDNEKTTKPKTKRNKGLSADIPRVQQRITLTDEERAGAIDTFFVTVKEELDITPAKVQVIEHLQEKAVYLDEDGKRCIRAAARPAHPLGKAIASTALLAFIIVSKYCDCLPLYRLEGILKRYGGSITRATMANWMIRLSLQLQSLVNLLQEVQLTADYLMIDETRMQVLKEPGMDPTGDKWIWVIRGGPPDKPVVIFDYDKSRAGAVAGRLLDGFEGSYVQTDGYSGYDWPVKAVGAVHLGCFDHSRRKFVAAIKAMPKAKKSEGKPAKCEVALEKIDALYRIEREIKGLPDDERYDYRQQHSVPKLEALHAWLVENAPKVEKDSLTGKAMFYTLKQWPKLIRYCEHGQLRISNILAENSVRPFAVGRRSWLFADTPAGAKASAIFFTLIESAKANGLEPFDYIKYVVDNIAAAETVEDIEALLPWNMK
ncbi:IS66 family transposase [Granulosicoccus antarcticus]|uniref:Transposase IS66 central domain-containing protein n=1 Tax=Granulosicoccus antarcticus IMCC3135 TaxID=1192854 RepID=A0A2Z2NH06_9GAMM|nr:IS66 family transposase [Granulosicoccus antarcticus]ASJ70363.1 hypothetical protein IMCC3135_01220 [Granulosicoccus antarcticus IMCC3135]